VARSSHQSLYPARLVSGGWRSELSWVEVLSVVVVVFVVLQLGTRMTAGGGVPLLRLHRMKVKTSGSGDHGEDPRRCFTKSWSRRLQRSGSSDQKASLYAKVLYRRTFSVPHDLRGSPPGLHVDGSAGPSGNGGGQRGFAAPSRLCDSQSGTRWGLGWNGYIYFVFVFLYLLWNGKKISY
jgi:hypothetical protein